MPVFEKTLYFGKKNITNLPYNEGGGLQALQALQQVHGGTLVVVQGTKPLNNFGFFISIIA